MTKINHVAYSWSMIQLQTTLEGESADSPLLVDATAIDWESNRKSEPIYGLGGQPRGRGFGNVEYTASIELSYLAQVQLRAKSEDGTLMGLGQFDLLISWVNDFAENVTTEVVTLAECYFSESGMSAKQDDTSITKTFDLHPYRIYTNASAQTSWSNELYAK